MRERINQLAKGIVDTELLPLILDPAAVDKILSPGEQIEGKFRIAGQQQSAVRGLVYSSHIRVKLKDQAFGGINQEIRYEVDSKYLEHGQEIKGAFYLITNCGEIELPYSFRVQAEKSEQTLRKLDSAQDFAALAQKDLDTAIRLFNYSDFTEAPFMQDILVRTLYDGLKGHGNRHHQLEEFLVALKVKDQVTVKVPDAEKVYESVTETISDCIVIEKSSWGYVTLQIRVDGDFIQLNKEKAGESDFQKNHYKIQYKIIPSKLHKGRNYGRIILNANEQIIPISIAAEGTDVSLDLREEDHFKRDFSDYFKLRLEYEINFLDRSRLLSQMVVQVEKMSFRNQQHLSPVLFQAELSLMKGNVEKVLTVLEKYKEMIYAVRQEQKELYCYYQYLMLQAVPDEGQREAFLKLILRYWENGQVSGQLLLMAYQLDPDFDLYSEFSLIQLRRIFNQGCTSPFIYVVACKIWNETPQLLEEIDRFAIQAIHCGVKYRMIGEKLSAVITSLFVGAKKIHRLFSGILTQLYEQYETKEILMGICALLIRQNSHEKADFLWYERALKAEISLTRLYEYFLYSLPEEYDRLIPREVIIYFSYDHNLDVQGKSVLYHNILTHMDREDALYQQYEREIGKFATEQLLNVRMNSRLAGIYDHMIYKNMIDMQMAKVLPAMLRANRLECENPFMKHVVVCYQELVTEETYTLNNKVAYIPLFSSNCIILFQDAYGNRFSNISYTKSRILVKPELEARCFELYPAHPMLLLQNCKDIEKKKVINETDAQVLERTSKELDIHPFFEYQIQQKLLDYYRNDNLEENKGKKADYLLRIDHQKLSQPDRCQLCECLIQNYYVKESCQMLQEYGWEGVSEDSLMNVADTLILQQLFEQDEWLLSLAHHLFAEERYDRVILDYLCEYFNGSSEQMYRILKRSRIDQVETYDLEERLLGQMLFSGYKSTIDQVFDWYVAKKKINDRLLRAFFTLKSAEYVFEDVLSDSKVFFYMESLMKKMLQQEKIPTIYLLALTKYYSSLSVLGEEQKMLCEEMMRHLKTLGIVLAYMKDLAKHISLWSDITDKAVIEYYGENRQKPDLKIRILPYEEEYYSVSMKRMFQSVYVKQLLLFEGEIAEYQIYQQADGKAVLKREGSISGSLVCDEAPQSRFSDLNRMGFYLEVKEEEKLAAAMEEYIIKNCVVNTLFEPI